MTASVFEIVVQGGVGPSPGLLNTRECHWDFLTFLLGLPTSPVLPPLPRTDFCHSSTKSLDCQASVLGSLACRMAVYVTAAVHWVLPGPVVCPGRHSVLIFEPLAHGQRVRSAVQQVLS